MVKATRKKSNLRGGQRLGGVAVNLARVTAKNSEPYVLIAKNGKRYYGPNSVAAVTKASIGQGGVTEPKLRRGQISGVAVNLNKVAAKDQNPYVLTAEDGTLYYGANPTEAVEKAVRKNGGVPPPLGYRQRISSAFGSLKQRFSRKNADRAPRSKGVPRPGSAANPPALWTGTSVNKNVGSALGTVPAASPALAPKFWSGTSVNKNVGSAVTPFGPAPPPLQAYGNASRNNALKRRRNNAANAARTEAAEAAAANAANAATTAEALREMQQSGLSVTPVAPPRSPAANWGSSQANINTRFPRQAVDTEAQDTEAQKTKRLQNADNPFLGGSRRFSKRTKKSKRNNRTGKCQS